MTDQLGQRRLSHVVEESPPLLDAPARGPASSVPGAPALRLEEIYEEEFENVWRSLRRLGVPEANLEDAVQEVFVAAHARLHTFDRSRPIRPWLFGIAVRVAAEMRRGARRARWRSQLTDALVDPHPSGPEEAVAARQAQALVDRALATLDFDQRVVIVMHDLENMTAPAIAESLSVPLNTIYSRLRLARAKVLAFLRQKPGRL
jgi:RNA polymerase sigma-70 factor (ECF subfamily)